MARYIPEWVEDALEHAIRAVDQALQEAEDEGVLDKAKYVIYNHIVTNWGSFPWDEEDDMR